MRAADAGLRRSLRVGVFGFAAYRLLPLITRHLATHHDAGLAVTQVEIPDRTAVLHRKVDVALGTPRDLPPTITATTVYLEHVVVALPNGHRRAGQPHVTLLKLSDEPIAGPAAGVAPEWDHLIEQAARAEGAVLRPAPATFGNLATALGVANEHRYPALLTSDVRHWSLPGVQLLDLRPALPWPTAVLVASDRIDPDVQAFTQAAQAAAAPPAAYKPE